MLTSGLTLSPDGWKFLPTLNFPPLNFLPTLNVAVRARLDPLETKISRGNSDEFTGVLVRPVACVL
jgi:hypothetical protein